MTIELWTMAGVVGMVGIILAIVIGYFSWSCNGNWLMRSLVCLLITATLFCTVVGIGHWYCSNTAEGIRAMKDQKSNLNGGLYREIIITTEDGREIFYYEGKCDIETDHGSYILFEDEDGYRHIIYKGVQDTIIINEIP